MTDWTVTIDAEVAVTDDLLVCVAEYLAPAGGAVSGGHGRLGTTLTVWDQPGPVEAATAGIGLLEAALAAHGITDTRHVAVEAMTVEEDDRRDSCR